MTVADLIEILKTHDQATLVVIAGLQGAAALELLASDVRVVQLRQISSKQSWFDPYHDAQLFELADEGDVEAVAIG